MNWCLSFQSDHSFQLGQLFPTPPLTPFPHGPGHTLGPASTGRARGEHGRRRAPRRPSESEAQPTPGARPRSGADPGKGPRIRRRRQAWGPGRGSLRGAERRGEHFLTLALSTHRPRPATAPSPSGRKLALAPPAPSYRSWRRLRLQPPRRPRRWRRQSPRLRCPPHPRCPELPPPAPRSRPPPPGPPRPPRPPRPPLPGPRLHFPARPRCCWRACFCDRLCCFWGWASRERPGAWRQRRRLPAARQLPARAEPAPGGREWRARAGGSSGARLAARPPPRHPGRRALSGFLEPARGHRGSQPRERRGLGTRARRSRAGGKRRVSGLF